MKSRVRPSLIALSVLAGLALLALVAAAWRGAGSWQTRAAAGAVLGALVLQLLIGMNLIWQGWPLWLGTAHNAGAALLVLAMASLFRRLLPHPRG